VVLFIPSVLMLIYPKIGRPDAFSYYNGLEKAKNPPFCVL